MKLAFALLATTALVAAVPAAASAATLTLDPVKSCYREGETLSLLGAGFTRDGPVDFSRGGESLGELFADAAGTVPGELTLPGLISGEREFPIPQPTSSTRRSSPRSRFALARPTY